jgi:hypothetical protein
VCTPKGDAAHKLIRRSSLACTRIRRRMSTLRLCKKRRTHCVGPGRLVVQDYVEQRSFDTDAPVVFDEAELAKAVHEKAYA